MRYIVTGGAGFIGSHIAEALKNKGHDVFIIDNFATGNRHNIPDGCSVVDTRGYPGALEILSNMSFDGVFHLGSPSSIPPYKESRLWVPQILSDFIYLAEFCLNKKCKLVFASTSNVYNGNDIPWHEDMQIIPNDFYAESRYMMERIAEVYEKFYGLKWIALRLFANYGPRELYKKSWASIISQLIWAKKENRIFPIYGDGTQTRDYVFVLDTARAFILAMNYEGICTPLNVGTGKAYCFNDLIKIIGGDVEYVKNPVMNYVKGTLADTTSASSIIGFDAKYSLEEGIKCLL